MDSVNVNNPTISIVIPMYNAEHYLAECLNSIVDQSYTDFEVVLVNDGSTDGTLSIAEAFAERDPRFSIHTTKNQGASLARKYGVEHSRGKFVAFIDADDCIKSFYLERLYSSMLTQEADIVCCEYDRDAEKTAPVVVTDVNNFLTAFLHNKRFVCAIWGCLYRKSLFESVFFPVQKYAEDTWLKMQVLMQSTKVVLLPDYGYIYRDNPGGAMSSAKGVQPQIDVLNCATWVYEEACRLSLEARYGCGDKILGLMFGIIATAVDCGQEGQLDERFQSRVRLSLKHGRISGVKGLLLHIYSFSPDLFFALWKGARLIKK